VKINRLLIANRGEIAVRIMKTARRLGIETVAVYSSADANAQHVKAADSCYLIGDAPAQDSYLSIDNILKAASDSAADAIHPGYGFLSENPEFAERCSLAGIIFVGPPVDAINAMGLKGVARAMMTKAGVPVLPGVNKVVIDEIEKQLEDIGYPVLVKPEAGGGGKGMKIVRDPGELIASIASAKREALSSFANDELIIEKYLDHPRHIEIQIFADSQGNCIHLNERDCSLQRRHQKIVEEAPAPNISEDLRQQMGTAAVMAATSINYVGAGTVEFLLEQNGNFYFMEMNTRLQVEHPVTELITGVDLVEWQLNIAMGEPLPLTQGDIGINGHAVEIRLYAEDPLNDFLPASGKIEYLKIPDNVRVDSGVVEGDSIGVFYDPMMMKIIAWGQTRQDAIDRLTAALFDLHVAGIKTNRDFLVCLLQDDTFRKGESTTDYLDTQSVFDAASAQNFHEALAAVAAYQLSKDDSSPWTSETNFRLNQPNARKLILFLEENEQVVSTAEINGSIDINTSYGQSTHRPEQSPAVFQMQNQVTVFLPNRTINIDLPSSTSQHASETEKNVNAPMSGKLISLLVQANSQVEAGTPLAVIEAMKMEHTICAPSDGKVHEIYFSVGDMVDEGLELLNFTPAEPTL
jgi:3-methylcrotonyl-CoA carboxylase alpha subunit